MEQDWCREDGSCVAAAACDNRHPLAIYEYMDFSREALGSCRREDSPNSRRGGSPAECHSCDVLNAYFPSAEDL